MMLESRDEFGKTAKNVYQLFLAGGNIGSVDLLTARLFFLDVAEKLSWLGPEFRFAANEANRVEIALAGYAKARGLL